MMAAYILVSYAALVGTIGPWGLGLVAAHIGLMLLPTFRTKR